MWLVPLNRPSCSLPCLFQHGINSYIVIHLYMTCAIDKQEKIFLIVLKSEMETYKFSLLHLNFYQCFCVSHGYSDLK